MSFGSQGPYYQNLKSGGGGYVQDNNSPGGYGSQATPGGAGERKAVNHSLRPVNIAQIYMAEQAHHTDSEYTLEGHPVTMITVVAHAREVVAQTTSDVYKLADGSGEIEARHWVESRGADDMDTEQEDTLGYVRVIGTIRTYQGRRHINATIVRVIEDPMEAFFHFNETMAITMFYKQGVPGGSSSIAAPSAANYTSGGATGAPANEYLTQFGPLENAVVQYFKANPSGPDGHHVKTILDGVVAMAPKALPGTRSEQAAALTTAIDNLTGEGALFSTLDEQHYALC